MIEDLIQAFTPAAVPPAAAKPADVKVDTTCPQCGGKHQWQPKRSQAWHCVRCQPPPAPSLVAFERGQPPESRESKPPEMFRHVIARYYYTVDERCHECGGRLVTETSWSDWSLDLKCWTCREPVFRAIADGAQNAN